MRLANIGIIHWALLLLVSLLAGCGGGGGGGNTASVTYTITGAVSGSTQAGVTINLTGAATASTTTDVSGNYSFSGLANGSYSITPSKNGHTFLPASTVINVNGADVGGTNFTAAANATPTYTLSGTVNGATQGGVTIDLTGAATNSTTTDSGGYYSFSGIVDGSYTITPSKTGYTFTPASSNVSVNGADVGGNNFTALSNTPVLSSFGPATSYINVGQSNATTFPTPLTVTLSSAPTNDTFVSVTSGNTSGVTVVGNGVTVLAGQTSAQVQVNGLTQASSVTLTATLDSTSLQANLRVLGATEQPVIASLTPAAPTILSGGTRTLTVTLDMPAPVGGTAVSLALTPSTAGSIPATVIVPAGQLSATFDYVDGSVVSSAAVSATLGGSAATSNITLMASGGLVINEIDYDNVGTDTAEYIEILNAGASSVNLAGYQLVLVNGANNTVYQTYDLGVAGSLAAGQYLVLGSNTALTSVPAGALKINMGSGQDYIQNGSPDGVAIVNTNNNALVDALSYEGSIIYAPISGLGTVSLVEGLALSASTADSNTIAGALCRNPNGMDSNNASSDWSVCATLTPGAANLP